MRLPFHAYGPDTDVPAALDDLRRGNEELPPETPWWRYPGSFLSSALYHGGHLTPATVDGVRYLAATIGEPDFGGDDPTLRWAALWFLRDVARAVCADIDESRRLAAGRDSPEVRSWLAAYLREERSVLEWTEADEPGRVLLAAARADCYDLLPAVYAAVEPLLHGDPRGRLEAAGAAVELTLHPELAGHRPGLLEYHLAEAGSSDNAHHRACMLLGAGALGGDTRAWLRDPHPGTRVCAAFAPALADDPEATAVLLAEALNPGVVGPEGFEGMMGLPALPNSTAHLAEVLCARVGDFETLLPVALASVPYRKAAYFDVGAEHPAAGALCEPYLRLAFPDGLPSSGTKSQRLLAGALARHDPAWFLDPGGLVPMELWFAKRQAEAWIGTFVRLGLPSDRAVWVAFSG
jgi:hypothetical protein